MNIIAFAGIDQSGKSSIIQELKLLLNSNKIYYTKEPRLFKNNLLKKIIVPSKLNFLFFFIDRIFHKLKLIKQRDKLIISDRSIACGIAYAYAVSKFNLFVHRLYCKKSWLIPLPKLILYIIPEFKLHDEEFKTEFRIKVITGYEKIVPNYFNNNIKIIRIYNKKDKMMESVNEIYSIIKRFY